MENTGEDREMEAKRTEDNTLKAKKIHSQYITLLQLNKSLKYIKVFSFMSNASLCFILDEGLETFLEIRDLEIYILLIYMVTRLQNYRTYRLLALFLLDVFLLCDNRSVQLPQVGIIRGCGTPVLEF